MAKNYTNKNILLMPTPSGTR